jgi:peptidoglycan/LPS O-acetylase OafA/YrhL
VTAVQDPTTAVPDVPARTTSVTTSSTRGATATLRRAGTLDPRNNSLNLVRLALAFAVLYSHSFPLSGRTDGPGWAGESLGGWAVIGFFAVSGYLITGSRLRTEGARYLINRVARIFPGFIVSLLVVAFVFAPVAYAAQHAGLGGFLSTPNTPLNYVFDNALLEMHDYSVAGTLAEVPHAFAWNGSLWSLWYEFLCYIVVGVAAVVPVVRRRPWPMVLMFVASVLVHANIATVAAYLGGNGEFVLLMKLLPYFLGGAVLFVLKERVPLHWYGALPALAVALGLVAWQPAWGGQLAAPLFTYFIMWFAAVVPSPRFVGVHDLSFGVYIYAFPVTQMLVLFGAHQSGLIVLNIGITVLTLALAALSWFLVERPSRDAVAAKKGALVAGRRISVPAASVLPEQRATLPTR